jgi:CheY-like chemotaxis protein
VSHAVETARPMIEESLHELTITLPPGPLYLNADLTRLSQVFSNLLTNSAKYTPVGGKIGITAERCDDRVVVAVQDSGIGIPPAAINDIFNMFSQVDRTIERTSGGLGIGLALVKGLVEMHGGTVIATSEGDGLGSLFTVALPLAEQINPMTAPQIGSGFSDDRRILVVDDSRDGAESLAMLLKMLGNEVEIAHNGLDAIAIAEQFQPDVILMDIGMPQLNGLDATRKIREQEWGRSPTIIALTGWGQDADRERSQNAGCDGHLTKPVSLDDLAAILNRFSGE